MYVTLGFFFFCFVVLYFLVWLPLKVYGEALKSYDKHGG